MKRIAMIGGTFNPVTRAHVELGEIAKKELGADCQVLYVPAADRFLSSWKGMERGEILSAEQRQRLLRLAVEPEGHLCVDCELTGVVSGRTVDTFLYLKQCYGSDCQLYYVCGSDKLPELHRWYQAERLLELAQMLVIPRDGDDPAAMIAENPFLCARSHRIQVSKTRRKYPEFSATQVRQSLKDGTEDWKDMVPEEIQGELQRR